MIARTERVAELIRASVGTSLVKLLPQSHLTVTQVDVSPDMKYANVWISQMQFEGRDSSLAMEQVKAHQHDLQQGVAGSLKTKFTPRLRVFFDDGTSHVQTIDELLDKL